jgi:regulatory protein
LSSHLTKDQEISQTELDDFKILSDGDKLYSQTLSLMARRLRSSWEIENYLHRKKVSRAIQIDLMTKLETGGLINDDKFARAWIKDRQLLKPTSRRKLKLELQQKHVSDEIINSALEQLDPDYEASTLKYLIMVKRRQTRYRDNMKLMQYLVRQGFNYGEVKQVIED